MTQSNEPRWLSADELAAWKSFVGVMVRLPAAMDAQLRRDSGMTHFEYIVLVNLADRDGSLRLKHLAKLAEASLSRLSQVVSRMEDRGWVERVPCPKDGRTTLAVLKDAGRRQLENAAPGHVEHVRQTVFDLLTEQEMAEVHEISSKILAAIDREAE